MFKHALSTWIIALLTAAVLAACAQGSPATQAVSVSPSETPLLPTNTPTPQITSEPEVTVYYEDGAQVELVSSQGTRVMIDVTSPSKLSAPPTEKDILLVTHGHSDHYNAAFASSFPGQKLIFEAGELNADDVSIVCLASAHQEFLEIKPVGGSNYIFLVVMDGLRFAHFGGIGQEELTPEQLETLGNIDVAFMQFANTASSMDLTNKKGFNLMAQVNPKLIIPTQHINLDTIAYAVDIWNSYISLEPGIRLSPSMLPGETNLLIMGFLAPSYQKVYNLTEWQN